MAEAAKLYGLGQLYELGKLSSGRAADLAGLPRVSFLQALAQYGVVIFELSKDDLRQDLHHA